MSLPRQFFAPSFRHRGLDWFFAALVGIMVYLASFAMAAETTLSAATLTWDRGMNSWLTVEIPAVGDEAAMPQAERIRQTLSVLHAMPDVITALLVPDDQMENLLRPWLNQPELLKELPIPALIDVERKPGSGLTAEDIRQQIKAAVPDAHVDDHAVWMADLVHLVRGLTLIGAVMIALTALTLIIAVSLLCRAVMATEHETISLLHVLGAVDDDIASHFALHAWRLAVPAAFIGFALAVMSAGGLLFFLRHFVDAGSMPLVYRFGLGGSILLVPCVALGIATLSARWSVLNYLYTMP